MSLTCTAQGRPDLPVDIKTGDLSSDQEKRLLETLVDRKSLFYLLKVYGISANVFHIRNIPTTCHLNFKVLKT